jgi:two-component system response regulator TctD
MRRDDDQGHGVDRRGAGQTVDNNERRRRRRRILLVEDNRNLRLTTARMLEHLGYEVTAVGDGPAAVEAFRRNPPDATILDVGLPGMSGREVLDALRAHKPRAPAVLCSGAPEDLAAAAEFAPPIGTLAKPYDIEKLSAVLQRILGS